MSPDRRGFWAWALQAYARPGVSEACLDLQDQHGQSVPFLLWAAWAAGEGRPLTAAHLGEAAGLAKRWEAVAVGPLRAARRGLKPAVEGMQDEAREALRVEVKALELKAEQALMARLEAETPASSGAPLPLEDVLSAAAAAWDGSAPQAALRRLARTLS